eukprot:130806-Chlamydomonas_euryale.AAC.15
MDTHSSVKLCTAMMKNCTLRSRDIGKKRINPIAGGHAHQRQEGKTHAELNRASPRTCAAALRKQHGKQFCGSGCRRG